MPSLTIEDRKQMLGPLPEPCARCRHTRVCHYCRSCDVFFTTCACDNPAEHLPPTHRVYLWSPLGIEAIPNFDDL